MRSRTNIAFGLSMRPARRSGRRRHAPIGLSECVVLLRDRPAEIRPHLHRIEIGRPRRAPGPAGARARRATGRSPEETPQSPQATSCPRSSSRCAATTLSAVRRDQYRSVS